MKEIRIVALIYVAIFFILFTISIFLTYRTNRIYQQNINYITSIFTEEIKEEYDVSDVYINNKRVYIKTQRLTNEWIGEIIKLINQSKDNINISNLIRFIEE